MLYIAITLFAIAAVLGLTLASLHIRGKVPALGFAMVHGLFAASGLVTLILAVTEVASGGLGTWSLIIFIVAALGGFVLATMHFRNREKPLPSGLIIGHGMVAVIGFALLLLWTFGNN